MIEYFHWHGRDDGPGDEHARWFTTIIDAEAELVPPNAIILVGFASDTGVARNNGRVGIGFLAGFFIRNFFFDKLKSAFLVFFISLYIKQHQ